MNQSWWKFLSLLYTSWRLCEAVLKKFCRAVLEIIQKSAKIQNLEVALRQVVRKQVSFQDRKKENTPKFPSIENDISEPFDTS